MTLPPRLKKASELAGSCDVLADIGTDHALLPVYMIKNGLCRRAYAADIGKAPLLRAKEYIKRNGLENLITAILSDGFDSICDDIDTAVIAGMGGELIRDILSRAKDRHVSRFVLQPMTAVCELRKHLYENGFLIEREEIVSEHGDKKLYTVMLALRVDVPEQFTDEDVLLSKPLRNGTGRERALYIKKAVLQREEIIANMKKAAEPDINLLEAVEKEYLILRKYI